jgi:hypothetical protein
MKQPHGEKMSERSPLARLVLFMVCLAVAGSILGGAHYLFIDLPAQKNLPAPQNAASSDQECLTCKNNCKLWQIMGDRDMYYTCMTQCQNHHCSGP